MNEYMEYRDKVIGTFDRCIAFAKQNGFSKQLVVMEGSKQSVVDNKIVIVAIGEAKRGKSTLLSAFLADEGLFPIDVEVTTSLVTSVGYGMPETIHVEYQNGSRESITRNEIQEYATEKGNTNNRKKAAWIDIQTPNARLKDGVVVVDTPGVGSLNPEHTAVTNSFLPRADVVLFISDATAPLTNSELIFLRNVKKHCGNFIFILTKKDLNASYEDIIAENIQKIEEFAMIPKEKIVYIPVSGTMRLASLKNGSERMAKSSNFEKLESVIWNSVSRNRAQIVITPPLGELAGCLKDMQNELRMKALALSEDERTRAALKEQLTNLQRNKQKLLSDSASWQTDIQREIDIIGMDQARMMNDFRGRATEAMEEGLNDPSMARKPTLLLNEIVLMASTASQEISEEAYARISRLREEFEENTNISLTSDIEKESPIVDNMPSIVFEKQKKLDVAILAGRKVSMNSMGGGTAGGIAGGVIGGIIGLIVGGPAGALIGIGYGAEIGGAGGLLVGGVKGAKDAADDIKSARESIPQIRAAIAKYIGQTVNAWQQDHPKYIKNVNYKLVKSLKESIQQNIASIDASAAKLQADSALSAEKRALEHQKLVAVSQEFKGLLADFASVSKPIQAPQAGSDSDPAEAASAPKQAQAGDADYSHLEA